MVEHEMREILFRGKRIYAGGEWVYGSLVSVKGRTYINFCDDEDVLWELEVDSSTVGQYFDKKDKNGNQIFEGDIVKVSQSGSSYYAKIEYDCGCFWVSNPDIQIPDTINNFKMEFIEVVGNVYDNKELLR